MRTDYPLNRRPNRSFFFGIIFTLIQMFVSPASAQNPHVSGSLDAANPPDASQFDVATIKPVGQDGTRDVSFNVYPGGRILITNWTLKNLICAAYQIKSWAVQGGPPWLERNRYDIEAKPAPANAGTRPYNILHDNWTLEDPDLRLMLQALLAERFQLKTHMVIKDGPILVLERAPGELHMTLTQRPFSRGGNGGIGFARGVVIDNTTMTQLASFLGNFLFQIPGLDKTGLTGSYDFRSKTVLTPEEQQDVLDPDNRLNLFLNATKEMGLKFTRSTGPVTTLVIDKVDYPSDN